jgi:hypothetical protein
MPLSYTKPSLSRKHFYEKESSKDILQFKAEECNVWEIVEIREPHNGKF